MLRPSKRGLRLCLLAILAVGLAPGTWVRTNVPPPDFAAPLLLNKLDAPQGFAAINGHTIALTDAWKLDSRNGHFGGYSALITLPNGRLLAGSDRGRLLEMPLPESAAPESPVQFSFFAGTNGGPRIFVDLEALERDEHAQTIWGAYEVRGRVESYSRDNPAASVRGTNIAAMKDWPQNGGAETMVRLNDGRFVLLAETSSYNSRIGLLFAGDPIDAPEPLKFRFMPPDGYSPVDGTLLPDGRVMILMRRVVWGLPPRFATGLVIADPAEIKAGGMWRGEMIATIAGPDLDENFEGIAAAKEEDGSILLYLIADDNISAFQDTLMLRLRWYPGGYPGGQPEGNSEPVLESAPDSKKAREDIPAAPL